MTFGHAAQPISGVAVVRDSTHAQPADLNAG